MSHRLVIIVGAPGSGKTYYGKRLAAKLAAAFLDIDTSSETMVRAALAAMNQNRDDRDSPDFKRNFRQPIYDTLFAIAAENIFHASVVITGPFTSEIRNPNWPEELARRFGKSVEIHYTYCEPTLRKKRIAQRANPRDTSKLADWENYLAYYGDEKPPCFEHTFIDTTS